MSCKIMKIITRIKSWFLAQDPVVRAAKNQNRSAAATAARTVIKAEKALREARDLARAQRRINAMRLEEAVRRAATLEELRHLAAEIQRAENEIKQRLQNMEPLLEKWATQEEIGLSDLFAHNTATRPGFVEEGEAADAPTPPVPAGTSPRPSADWEL